MIERPDSELVSRVHPSPNVEPRCGGKTPSILLLHYTGVPTVEQAIDWLSRPESKVSCHYVIDEAGEVTQMVAETMRAWHAGQSYWAGETDINSCSIGVEIQNPGHCGGYPDFPEAQMESVVELCHDIISRHRILPRGVLAHSDVAPRRKIDPGEKFDWHRLARSGVGIGAYPERVCRFDGFPVFSQVPKITFARTLLKYLGYDIEKGSTVDEQMNCIVSAFQRHYRPACVDGMLDESTLATLQCVVGEAGGEYLVT